MVLSIQVNSNISPSPNSVLIPLSSLKNYGFKEEHWENSPMGIQRGILASLKLICATPFVSVLGLKKPTNPSRTTPAANLVNTTFSLTHTLQADLSTRLLTEIPLQSNGIGGIRFDDVFGKSGKTNNLVIPFEDIAPYGYLSGEDSRSFFSAFFQCLTLSDAIPLRAKQNPSGVIAKKVSNPLVSPIPARKVLLSFTYSITFQQILNVDDTLDVNYIPL